MVQTQHKVAIRLGIDGALEVKQGLRDVGEIGNREMGKLAEGARVAQRAFSLLGPVLAGISVGALAAFTKNAIDAVGGLGELADQVGVSTNALQALSLASTQAGISGEELQRGLAALTRKIADAASGEQAAEQAFARLGIAFRNTEGQARPTEAVLVDIAEKLKDLENPAERAAVVTSMFGDRIGQERHIPQLDIVLIGLLDDRVAFVQRRFEACTVLFRKWIEPLTPCKKCPRQFDVCPHRLETADYRLDGLADSAQGVDNHGDGVRRVLRPGGERAIGAQALDTAHRIVRAKEHLLELLREWGTRMTPLRHTGPRQSRLARRGLVSSGFYPALSDR